MAVATTRRSQQERSDQTVGSLLGVARDLFGTSGYAATSLDDVARAAGVSKGALYHHLASKPELFRAVFERAQQLLAKKVLTASAKKREHWEAFFTGCRAFLEGSLDPKVQRITLLDAPGVLGWQRMRELEAPHSFSVMKSAVEKAAADGRLPHRDPDTVAHIILGAMCEAVAHIATSEKPHRL